jgi:protein-L-isoaspartate(D-aspartate) O-methyltransferase
VISTGGGDHHAGPRQALVDLLRGLGIGDERVLGAIGRVPRHLFVPPDLEHLAYENRALPIGEGQTISQPLVVALTTEALELEGGEKVLEVGTGSGYQAAILGELAGEVHTVELNEHLEAAASELLERLGYRNIHCHRADGARGWPEAAPYDAICITAACPGVPPPLYSHLAMGGRMVIPVGGSNGQILRQVRRLPEGDLMTDLTPVVFVPLLGEFGW